MKYKTYIKIFWTVLIIVAIVLTYLWWGAKNSGAHGDHKVDICHFDGRSGNYQNLNIDEHSADDHLENHHKDYKGKCNTEYHWFKDGRADKGPCTGKCESNEGTRTVTQKYECKKVTVGEDGDGGNECKKDETTTKEWSEACKVKEPPACEEPTDLCSNIDGTQEEVPQGTERNENGECLPIPVPTPEPPKGFSESGAPQCTDGTTILLPANVHVVRHGTSADVNFFITQGDSANIYYKEVGETNWTHSVLRDDVVKYKGIDGYVSYPVRDLKLGVGYVFGVQQVQGCGGGQTVTAVVVDGPQSVTFPFSFWEWAK